MGISSLTPSDDGTHDSGLVEVRVDGGGEGLGFVLNRMVVLLVSWSEAGRRASLPSHTPFSKRMSSYSGNVDGVRGGRKSRAEMHGTTAHVCSKQECRGYSGNRGQCSHTACKGVRKGEAPREREARTHTGQRPHQPLAIRIPMCIYMYMHMGMRMRIPRERKKAEIISTQRHSSPHATPQLRE